MKGDEGSSESSSLHPQYIIAIHFFLQFNSSDVRYEVIMT